MADREPIEVDTDPVHPWEEWMAQDTLDPNYYEPREEDS